MSGLFGFVPVATSLILGIVYVAAGDASLARKLSDTAVFLIAVPEERKLHCLETT